MLVACRDSWAADAILRACELLSFYPEHAHELGKHVAIVLIQTFEPASC